MDPPIKVIRAKDMATSQRAMEEEEVEKEGDMEKDSRDMAME